METAALCTLILLISFVVGAFCMFCHLQKDKKALQGKNDSLQDALKATKAQNTLLWKGQQALWHAYSEELRNNRQPIT